MKRWLLLVLLCACGGKKDDNKPAAGEVAATVKKPATPLAEAKQLLAAQRKRNPEEWVALAHAQAVAKDPAAKQTLDDALSAARSDQLDGPAALVLATDVLILLGDTTNTQKLLDEGIAGLKAHNFPEDKLATLLSPVHDIQNPEALKRLARAGVVEVKKTDALVARMRPSGPAWDEVLEGGRGKGKRNVVFHELAHKIDMVDGTIDGTPPLPDARRWAQVCSEVFLELRERVEDGKRTFLDEYAATNEAEFFAVATEAYFMAPAKLEAAHPELFAVLRDFYRFDPR
jgi:hypothetical protein